MNTVFRQSRLRGMALALLVASLAIRAVVPTGYMPGKLLEGELAELCPVASAATFALLGDDAAHTHHHHGADESSSVSISTACPIGSSLYADVLPVVADPIELQRLPFESTTVDPARPNPASFSSRPQARAPPLA